MTPTDEAQAARVDLLLIVVQELARAMLPVQAARPRAEAVALAYISASADEALTADLAPLLAALG